ncbi:MAG: DUF4956 domain-containing protein [Candidatus Delongbacteria bacterium]|jgi:uncharacterized membrane protein YhiD involved in acid resistance|nr:DUF4956 domain-containing protein [Candidatus Delongbacteria bacterium]
MNKIETFEQFMATTKGIIGINDFLINILIAAILSGLLGIVYVKFGKSLSNRRQFAANFIIITLTTMMIITIVKSSLALSLGLVGALSIVRFRTAIKEPEELAYMFLSISIGLGMGASQTQITVTGFLFIVGVIILRGFIKKNEKNGNFFITINTVGTDFSLSKLTGILEKHCMKAELKRIDDENNTINIVLNAEFRRSDDIEGVRNELKSIDENIKISIFEDKGLV